VNSCPYYDVSDEVYGRRNAMVETMNDRLEHFVSKMREFGLSHEADPNLPSSRLEISLCDDWDSSLPPESNVVDDVPLTNLEEVFDSPLTSLSLVAPSFSSKPMNTNVSDLTLLASPIHFAQCMWLKTGETSKGDVSVLKDDPLDRSTTLCLVKPYLEEAPFEKFRVML